MKRTNRRFISILLSLMIVIATCFGTAATAFAQEEAADQNNAAIQLMENTPVQVKSGDSLTGVVDINGTTSPTVYTTPKDTKYTSYAFSVYMPVKGALEIVYACTNQKLGDAYFSVSGASYGSQFTDKDNLGHKIYCVDAAGWVTLNLSNSGTDGGNAVLFDMCYAQATSKTLKATSTKKTYLFGTDGSNSAVTSFKITVPAKGYLTLNMGEYNGTSSVYFKTSGFKDFEYLSSSDAERYIGVKKGTYTIKVKSYGPICGVVYKFTKIKEGKFGTKKAKAASLTKKKVRKGVIVTNKKQTHWYKIKNPKLQKVTLVVNGTKLVGGGNYGGFKITVYDSKGSMGSRNLTHSDPSGSYSLYTLGKNNKLMPGTYWVKVQSYNSGSGYFTVKWK